MGNTMTGTAQAETLVATIDALWETVGMPGGIGQSWRDDLMWQTGRLAGVLTIVDGSRYYGTEPVATIDKGLVAGWIMDARQAMVRARRNPFGDPAFD